MQAKTCTRDIYQTTSCLAMRHYNEPDVCHQTHKYSIIHISKIYESTHMNW